MGSVEVLQAESKFSQIIVAGDFKVVDIA